MGTRSAHKKCVHASTPSTLSLAVADRLYVEQQPRTPSPSVDGGESYVSQEDKLAMKIGHVVLSATVTGVFSDAHWHTINMLLGHRSFVVDNGPHAANHRYAQQTVGGDDNRFRHDHQR